MYIKLHRNTSYWQNLEVVDSTGEVEKAITNNKRKTLKVQFRLTNQPSNLFQGTLELDMRDKQKPTIKLNGRAVSL